MEERKMVSVFKGLCPLSFPAQWAKGMKRESFGASGNEAFIKFGNGKGFGMSVRNEGRTVHRCVRVLSMEQIDEIEEEYND